ncbi:MAG: hypothetical protein M3Z11_08290 [Candidatus Dormibacteraeota bacterium]|nr:hypothetical protein [Candidatus Dormibacteraeota bacterium]
MTGQERWDAHASFMNGLVEAGFVALGGPVGDGPTILLIVKAKNEPAIHARLAADPWTPMGLLVVTKVESWQILLGEAPIS